MAGVSTNPEHLFVSDAERSAADRRAVHRSLLATRKGTFELKSKPLTMELYSVTLSPSSASTADGKGRNEKGHAGARAEPHRHSEPHFSELHGNDERVDSDGESDDKRNTLTSVTDTYDAAEQQQKQQTTVRLALGLANATVRVVNTENGQTDFVLRKGHDAPITGVAIVPRTIGSAGLEEDSTSVEVVLAPRLLATCSWDKTALLWDVNTRQPLERFVGHSDFLQCIIAARDGSALVTGSRDATAKHWDVETGKCVQTFEGHKRVIDALSFGTADSEYSNMLFTCSSDCSVRMWDFRSGGAAVRAFAGHLTSVTDLSMHPEGSAMFTSSADKTVLRWDIATGKIEKKYEHPDWVKRVLACGPALFTGTSEGLIRRYDTSTDEMVSEENAHAEEVTGLCHYGGVLYSCSADRLLSSWSLRDFGRIVESAAAASPNPAIHASALAAALATDTEGLSLSDKELMDEIFD